MRKDFFTASTNKTLVIQLIVHYDTDVEHVIIYRMRRFSHERSETRNRNGHARHVTVNISTAIRSATNTALRDAEVFSCKGKYYIEKIISMKFSYSEAFNLNKTYVFKMLLFLNNYKILLEVP